MNRTVGQIIGIASSVITVLNPVYKKKLMMLCNNIMTNLLLGLNLVFLGEFGSGIFLFAVAVVQAIINLIHTLKGQQVKTAEKIIFFILYVGLGFYGLVTAPGFVPAINVQNLVELLPIAGAVFSMSFVFARKEQVARRYLLCCDSLWAIYYIIIRSTALIGSCISITLCLISLYRYREKKTN